MPFIKGDPVVACILWLHPLNNYKITLIVVHVWRTLLVNLRQRFALKPPIVRLDINYINLFDGSISVYLTLTKRKNYIYIIFFSFHKFKRY